MKTAIQTSCNDIIAELIDTIELAHLTKIIHIMHKHLETEKQQIIEAYIEGHTTIQGAGCSTTYYTSTFETNKETLK